jgi:integral membrane protein
VSPTVRWFLWIARAEGLSLILLFGVAMPLKYALGVPELVKPVGMAHGALFIVYALALWHAGRAAGWGWGRLALGFVASFVPFGTVLFEARALR